MRSTIEWVIPPVAVDGGGVEAEAAVTDERLDPGIPEHLGVHRYLVGAAVAGGVEDGLADGRHQGLDMAVERAVADDHHVHRHPVVGLDLVGDAIECRRQGARRILADERRPS